MSKEIRTWPEVLQERKDLISGGWKFIKSQKVPKGDIVGDLFEKDKLQCMFFWASGNVIQLDRNNN